MPRHGSKRFNISSEVSSVLPQHISNESPDLEVFLKKYLEFMETDNKALYYLNTISSSRDIDEADETFLPRLQNEIGQAIPRKFSAEPRLLYKHLTELYKSRGTIESIKAFFRFFYDDEVEIYYPKDDMFTPSDGKWFSQTDLILDNPSNFTPSYTYTLTSDTTVITGGDDNSDILTFDGLLGLIHPAGFIFFGEILLTIYLNSILSLNQPGRQRGGLPFPIVIPVTHAKAQFVKSRSNTTRKSDSGYSGVLASYILKEFKFVYHVGEFGQREYFETFKFKLDSPISNWSNILFIDVTNKTVDGNIEAEIYQSTAGGPAHAYTVTPTNAAGTKPPVIEGPSHHLPYI